MKIYKVKVNGKVYEVELEAVTETAGEVKVEKTEVKTETATAGTGSINAPIAGKLLKLSVKVGDVVKKGQTVAVIEAMKLENEVPSTVEGKVVELKAKVGDAVNNGDVLIVLG